MLTKFSVSNFKNFDSKLALYFTSNHNFDFNEDVVRKGYITKSIVYGENGSGKSNLCLAILDITLHLTDNMSVKKNYAPYLSLDSVSGYAEFEYEFMFDGDVVSYKYSKNTDMQLSSEELYINGELVLCYDYIDNIGHSTLKGTKDLVLESNNNNVSRIKYIANTALLDKSDHVCSVFLKFMDFVNRMLLFYPSQENGYQGFSSQTEDVLKGIIRQNKTREFNDFLNDCGINCDLTEFKSMGEKEIIWNFPKTKKEIPFPDIASTGTMSVATFFYWYIVMNKASFVLIDEFDAFYHFDLAKKIVKKLKEFRDIQVLLTTHNTDLLNNDLLRPDCYYVLQNGTIDSLDNLTDMDIQKAHNLQRMYKAGLFDVG